MKVVLLAAGLSSRMEGGNKLIRDIGGSCLLEIAIRNALSYSSEIYIVTGNERTAVEEIAKRHNLTTIFNPAYESGQESSIRAALEALEGPMIILPSDMPLIEKEDYIRCGEELSGHLAARPIYNGKPGHPVVLSEDFRKLYLSRDARLRDLLMDVDTSFYPTERSASVYDIDTEEAFEGFVASLRQK